MKTGREDLLSRDVVKIDRAKKSFFLLMFFNFYRTNQMKGKIFSNSHNYFAVVRKSTKWNLIFLNLIF